MAQSNSSGKWLLIAIVIIIFLLAGAIIWLLVGGSNNPTLITPSSGPPTSAPTASRAPTGPNMVAPSSSAIKVGWLVSQYLANAHVYGAGYHDHVTAIHFLLVDPEIELYALVEPDSLNNPKQQDIISRYFLPNHTLIVTDPAALAKIQVIVASRTFLVRHDVADSVNQAVRNGAGLFIHVGMDRSEQSSSTIEEMTHLQDPQSCFIRAPIPCEVISDDPLLAGLRATLPDGRLSIAQFNGTIGILHDATPLIVADPAALKNEGQPPPSTAPTTESSPGLYPLYIAHLGKGTIINCQWDSIPPALVQASKRRFYIHCCEYLAGRKLD